MQINLKHVSAGEIFNNSGEQTLLYGDFNTLNYIYEKGLRLDYRSDIYPDSTFVFLILRLLFRKQYKKIVSTDLLYEIMELAAFKGKKLFFFGDTIDILEKLKMELEKKYPGINIAGYYSGYQINQNDLFAYLESCKPEILFIGLGAGRQEEWVYKYRDKLHIPVIITTGGWFRYLAGANKRAPRWMIDLSLEWAYKLLNEFPRVWHRYFITAPVFLSRVLTHKIKLKLDLENSFHQ